VPLILKMPAAAQHGAVIDAQVRTTDILPTILSLTGTAAPAELNGESLVPLIKGETPPGTSLFAETDYPLRWGWAPLRALRAENLKLIEAPRAELYDLKSDPSELKNLYAADTAHVLGLRAQMAKWKSKLPASATDNAGESLPDPKDKVEVQNLLHRAMLASDDERANDARGFLEKALELDPASPTALRQLGELELAAGDFAKAAAHLKRTREVSPEDSTAAFELGQALEKSGDLPGARDALEASLKLVPSQMPARLLLGRVYLRLNDGRNAEDQFEAAQLVDSNNLDARLGLAEAQIQQSKFADALPDLEALSKNTPPNAAALRLLARTYRGLGREHEAQSAEAKAAAAGKN
jgi:tetratricopeptide (TPR) repeat protein